MLLLHPFSNIHTIPCLCCADCESCVLDGLCGCWAAHGDAGQLLLPLVSLVGSTLAAHSGELDRPQCWHAGRPDSGRSETTRHVHATRRSLKCRGPALSCAWASCRSEFVQWTCWNTLLTMQLMLTHVGCAWTDREGRPVQHLLGFGELGLLWIDAIMSGC